MSTDHSAMPSATDINRLRAEALPRGVVTATPSLGSQARNAIITETSGKQFIAFDVECASLLREGFGNYFQADRIACVVVAPAQGEGGFIARRRNTMPNSRLFARNCRL